MPGSVWVENRHNLSKPRNPRPERERLCRLRKRALIPPALLNRKSSGYDDYFINILRVFRIVIAINYVLHIWVVLESDQRSLKSAVTDRK